jgi:hypothetical protein
MTISRTNFKLLALKNMTMVVISTRLEWKSATWKWMRTTWPNLSRQVRARNKLRFKSILNLKWKFSQVFEELIQWLLHLLSPQISSRLVRSFSSLFLHGFVSLDIFEISVMNLKISHFRKLCSASLSIIIWSFALLRYHNCFSYSQGWIQAHCYKTKLRCGNFIHSHMKLFTCIRKYLH